jgi:hypothetical protein
MSMKTPWAGFAGYPKGLKTQMKYQGDHLHETPSMSWSLQLNLWRIG